MIRIRLRDYPRPPGSGFLELLTDQQTGEGTWLADCDLTGGKAALRTAALAARAKLTRLNPQILDGTAAWAAESMTPWAEVILREVLGEGGSLAHS